MSMQRNINEGDFKRRLAKLERFMNNSNLNHSAIGREGLEVYDGGWIRILNGGLQVIGTATISGTLDVTGTFNASGDNNMSGTNNLSGTNHITGPTNVTGDLTIEGITTISGNTSITGELIVTGPTKLDGVTDIGGDTTITGLLDVQGDSTISGTLDVTGPMSTKGTLAVEGVTTLSNDLNIEEGGKINAGNLQIEPANGGQINFLGGGIAASPTFGLVVTHNLGVRINGPSVTIPVDVKTGAEANVHIDAAGRLWRI
ncbi:hypothetical protein [Glutamicibacter sp.]|uniref:hypothetical protein n=1 Tax=Glutamicibacter sp. TaxID=1931995 RepID=UPI0028BDBFFF|nr:hypothetical protein [Glutamicibacter sp.]